MVSNLQPCYSLGTEQSPSVEFFHTPFHTFHTIPHCATLPHSLFIINYQLLCNYNLRKRKAS